MTVGYHRDLPLPRDKHVTPRQTEIVKLIAAGYSKDEIAVELGISPRTVKSHCDMLRLKLRCDRQREIPLAFMCRTGIDPFPRPETVR